MAEFIFAIICVVISIVSFVMGDYEWGRYYSLMSALMLVLDRQQRLARRSR